MPLMMPVLDEYDDGMTYDLRWLRLENTHEMKLGKMETGA